MLPMAEKTRVVSMRNGNKEYDVRIDRQSVWGNRHHMRNDTAAERDRVIHEYGIDLWTAIYSGVITLSQLDALYGKRLGCWCHPKPCHGDELAKAVIWAHKTLEKWKRIEATYKRRKRMKKQSKTACRKTVNKEQEYKYIKDPDKARSVLDDLRCGRY